VQRLNTNNNIKSSKKQKHFNQLQAMKKNISKIALKTDRIVSLSKENAKAIIAGRPPRVSDKTFCGASICWCND
jgi:hypothetical protein